MRPSKRSEILAAASRLVQREGVAAVTYDSIAAESGITKGGLVYHFPTRESLIAALHDFHAGRWEQGMAAAAGTNVVDATDIERLRGYVRAAATSATRADLLFLLEGSTNAEHAAPWNEVMARWAPPIPSADADDAALDQFIARLAADGLWLFEALASTPLAPELRRRVADLVADRLIATQNKDRPHP